jgi:hypothetical protein
MSEKAVAALVSLELMQLKSGISPAKALAVARRKGNCVIETEKHQCIKTKNSATDKHGR